jgi:hypothetical protein
MKIKIIKRIDEMKMGYNVSDVMPNESVLEDLDIFKNLQASQQEVQKILMKNILFYDLETSGLSRKNDVIHQFAALQYTPDSLNNSPSQPDNLYLSKCTVPPEVINMKGKILGRRARALNKTGYKDLKSKLLFTYSDRKTGEEVTAISAGWNSYKTFNDKTGYGKLINTNDYWLDAIILPTFFFVLIRNTVPSNKMTQKTGWHRNIQIGITDDVVSKYFDYFMEYLKKQSDDNSTGVNQGSLSRKYLALKNIYNSEDPSIYQVKYFYDILFKEDDLLSFVVSHRSKKDAKELKKRISQIKNLIDMSRKENQELTHAKDFPLKHFRSQDFGIETDSNGKVIEKTEKEGLQGFIDFVTSVSPVPKPTTEDILTLEPAVASFPTSGDTIIIGHNIVAFDNSFILERCKNHKIEPEGFSDLFVYDTRTLFEYFLRYVNYAKYALNFFTYGQEGKLLDQSPEFKKVWKESGMSIIYKGLLTKTGTLSAKLEKFMKMYNKDAKQTHTADDDCVQLAIVFNAIRPEIVKCIKQTIDLIDFVDNNKAFRTYYTTKRNTKNYTKKGFSKTNLGDYKKKVVEKIEKSVGEDDFYPEVVYTYLDHLYKKGSSFKKQSEKQQQFMQEMRILLNMSDEQSKQFYDQASFFYLKHANKKEEESNLVSIDPGYAQQSIPGLFDYKGLQENKAKTIKVKIK